MKILGTDYFFYNITDFKKSMEFYRDILGLKPTMVTGEQWAEFETGNMTLAIGVFGAVNDGGKSKNSASVALAIDDVPKALEYLKGKGVRIDHELSDFPTCHMAIIADPDGNQIILHHRKDGTVG